jgi:murein DD-endopeptidase MepM/ murein hydrolase activator NlpD
MNRNSERIPMTAGMKFKLQITDKYDNIHIMICRSICSKIVWLCLAVVFLTMTVRASYALDLLLPQRSFQGDLVVGRIDPGSKITVNGRPQTVDPQGYFVLAFPRDLKRDLLVKARLKNNSTSHTIQTLKYDWRIQNINGLAKNHVNPSQSERMQMDLDRSKIKAVRKTQPYVLPLFLKKGFVMPVKGRISGVFGSQRILNGEPRSPHSGLDIAAPRGTPAHSPADGIARLVVKDTFLMGNVLMIDHGLGVSSIFIHLDSVDVQEGDLVRQGEIVARVGQTGRATGPHLHWGVSVGSTPVDPLRLINRAFTLP